MSDNTTPGQIRVGIIGIGGMARAHVNQMAPVEGLTITALCDTNPAQFERAAEKFPAFADVFTTDDYRELLKRDDVDAVLIATPHTQHIDQAFAAVEAGKHVLLEKPMVCQVEDAKKLLARLEGHDKVFALAYQRHAMGQFKYMRERIHSGDLGQVTFLSALQCQGWKKGTAGSWRQEPELSGGGQLNDSGSHLIDILLWVTGLTVAEVSAYVDNRGTPVDINSALAVKFTNGAQGNISVIGESVVGWHEDISIWCEKGAFLYRNGKLEETDASGKRTALEGDDLPFTETIDANFARCIRGETTPAAPPLCGLRTIELTEAAWESGKQNGKPVVMNPME